MGHSFKLTLIASMVSVMIAPTVWAQERSSLNKAGSGEQTEGKIRQLGEIELPNTSARMLVQSPTPSNPANQAEDRGSKVIQITGVKANPTAKGVEVILETPVGTQLQVTNRSNGNNFIVDVSGGQLRLADGNAFTFRSEKPVEGITQIIVTNIDANTVRVTVVGEKALPTVELYDDNAGLVFAVASTGTATSPQQPQTQLPENQTQPTQPSAEGDQPIELVVTGEQDGYRVPDATTATKTDTPLRDIPQAIQVVPQQVLQDQQVTTNLAEALKNVPGVQQGGNSSSRGAYQLPNIRGFRSTSNLSKDGLLDPSIQFLGFDAIGIEQIEVLKGPASVLYGLGSPGGAINLVSKKPLSAPYYSVEFSAGSFNFYRGAINLTGPLNDSKTVLYRLNAAAQTTESFLDFYDEQQYFVAPTLTWQIGDRTKLTLAAEYLDRPKDNNQIGLPAIGSVLPNPNGKIPSSRYISEPSDQDNRHAFRVGYNLEHRFSQNWQLRNAFRASWIDEDRLLTTSSSLASDNRTLNRFFSNSDASYNYFNSDTYVVGKFSTGSIQHQLVMGLNFTKEDYDSTTIRYQAASLDLSNPVYGQPPGNNVLVRFSSFSATNAFGIYVQDQVTLAENLKLLLGGRFDFVEQTNEDRVANTESSESSDAFSPRVGIVYLPIPPISLYASYSRSFTPVSGTAFDRSRFLPERGTQYEVGIKADLSNRFSTTLAFYDLTLSNVLTNDPVNQGFSIQTGEQRSRGIEFSVGGEILPGWNMIAGYAYTNAEITKDNTYTPGTLLNNIPKHSFNIWTSYEIQSGSLKGFGVSGGLFFIDNRQGDIPNTFELPSYFRTDAAIFYKRDQFRAAINFKNLFNVDYFESAGSRLSVHPGDPFTVQGTISWEF